MNFHRVLTIVLIALPALLSGYDLHAASRWSVPKAAYTWDLRRWDKQPMNPRSEGDCSELKVDPAPFGATRYQGKMGWCYSYATTDLLSYCMKTERISAADLALNNARSKWNGVNMDDFLAELDRGGVPWEAVTTLRKAKGGACPERLMTSDAQSFHEVEKLDDLSLYDQYAHGTHELIQKFLRLRDEYNDARIKTGEGTLACANPCGDNSSCFRSLSKHRPDVFGDREFLDLLGNATSASALVDLFDQRLCDAHRIPFSDSCSRMTAWGAPTITKDAQGNPLTTAGHVLFNDIDGELKSGLPVEFAVNSGFLNTKTSSDVGGGPHAMVAIGRHYRQPTATEPGGCYYQVRNSWGKNCSGYSAFVKDCDPNTGYFWVSESLMDKNLQFINFFTH